MTISKWCERYIYTVRMSSLRCTVLHQTRWCSEIFEVVVVLLGHLGRVRVSLAVVLWVAVEALGVTWVSDRGDDGTPASAVEDIVPADVLEEGVVLYALGATADVAEPSGAIDGAEGADDVLGFIGYARLDGK